MRLLCPKEVLTSVLDIDISKLKRKGIKGVLIDLDNTLVRWDSDEMEDQFFQWVVDAKKQGLKIGLLSNGRSKRVLHFAQMLDIPSIAKALKPRRRPFYQGLAQLQLKAHEVAMVGDQIFTDVFGGNRLGLYTILITPLSDKELTSTRVMRKIERRVLNRLLKQGLVSKEAIHQRNGGSR